MIDFRKLPLTLSLPAALLLGATALVSSPGGQDPADDGPQIAVVDIDQVLQSYPGALAKQAEWKAMEGSFQKQMEELRAEVEAALAAREGFDEGTEERARMNLEYELKRLRFEENGKIFEIVAGRQRLDISLGLYDEIRQGIAQFAKTKGIDVVLRMRPDRPANDKSLRAEANQLRELLYFAPEIDLTEDVIRFLKQWKPGER